MNGTRFTTCKRVPFFIKKTYNETSRFKYNASKRVSFANS